MGLYHPALYACLRAAYARHMGGEHCRCAGTGDADWLTKHDGWQLGGKWEGSSFNAHLRRREAHGAQLDSCGVRIARSHGIRHVACQTVCCARGGKGQAGPINSVCMPQQCAGCGQEAQRALLC